MEENSLTNINQIREKEYEFKKLMIMYNSALKGIETKIQIISDEFQMLYSYNPIEHIKTRIKSPESIVKKLKKRGLPITYDSLVNNLNDIAGVRIICSFIPDIYKMVEMFDSSTDIQIIEKKDYIKNPKESGYSSYHLIVSVPVSFASGIVNVKAEIQIRTIAMDFWASLEHKIKYKYSEELPQNVQRELKECSKIANKLDKRMSKLGGNLIEEFEQDMYLYKKNSKEESLWKNKKKSKNLTKCLYQRQ